LLEFLVGAEGDEAFAGQRRQDWERTAEHWAVLEVGRAFGTAEELLVQFTEFAEATADFPLEI